MRKWLAMTDTQTSEWVNRAISKDAVSLIISFSSHRNRLSILTIRFCIQFEPEETATHSSSIVDLIESCKAPVEFILGLKWPDEYGHAKFLTGLSRVCPSSLSSLGSGN